MAKNTIVLRATGNYQDLVEGGMTSIYDVVECDIDEEKGMLEYETRGFPSTPSFTGKPPSLEYLQSIPEVGRISKRGVSKMDIIYDEEVAELRERGVIVTILPREN